MGKIVIKKSYFIFNDLLQKIKVCAKKISFYLKIVIFYACVDLGNFPASKMVSRAVLPSPRLLQKLISKSIYHIIKLRFNLIALIKLLRTLLRSAGLLCRPALNHISLSDPIIFCQFPLYGECTAATALQCMRLV